MAIRPPQKRREDIFFLAFVFLLLVANFIGFARTYYLAGMFRATLPSRLVHIHGALFTSWLLLLLLQTSLIVGGRIRWHRRLGVLAGVIAALMLIVGPLVLIAALRRHAFPSNAADLIFAADLGGLALFALFVALGLRFRNNSVVHKRLMLFATIAILPPGLDRWSFSFMESSFAFFGIYLAFPFAIIVYDLSSVRKVHRVTLLCSVLITAYIFGAGRLSKTSIWHRVTESVQETSSLRNRLPRWPRRAVEVQITCGQRDDWIGSGTATQMAIEDTKVVLTFDVSSKRCFEQLLLYNDLSAYSK